MEDYEFRRLEQYLKNRGVHCYRYMDRSKVDALHKAGLSFLFYSFFGENIYTGDCETIILARPQSSRRPSRRLLLVAQRFGEELVSREKAAAG